MKVKYLPQRGHLGKWIWRTSAVAVVATTAILASLALTGAGSAGAVPVTQPKTNQARATALVLNPPAHQMAKLDFLLGRYKCVTTPASGGGSITVYETTRKILDGNYYQQVSTFDIPGLGGFTAYWTIGWNPVDLNYIAEYFDNLGITGTSTSAGFKQGAIDFSGPYVDVLTPGGVSGVGKGMHITGKDIFTPNGPGHYTDSSNFLQNGKWALSSTADCRLIP